MTNSSQQSFSNFAVTDETDLNVGIPEFKKGHAVVGNHDMKTEHLKVEGRQGQPQLKVPQAIEQYFHG